MLDPSRLTEAERQVLAAALDDQIRYQGKRLRRRLTMFSQHDATWRLHVATDLRFRLRVTTQRARKEVS